MIHQILPESVVTLCQSPEQWELTWKEKSFLARIYVLNHQCIWEDWIAKRYYKLPEFFSVFLGELFSFRDKVGYVLKQFSLYHTTLITGQKNCVSLRDKEYKTLIYFLNQYQQKIHKEELLKNIWKYNTEIETFTLETHVGQLNKKLKPCYHRIIREQDYFALVPYTEL